jgi:hypothetical protein
MSTPTRPAATCRQRTRLAAIAVAVIAVAMTTMAVGLVVAPAAADSGGPDDESVPEVFAFLWLDVSEGQFDPGGTVTLMCSPFGDGGSHPTPMRACDSLRAVGGDFEELPSAGEDSPGCFDIEDPAWLTAEGLWVQDGALTFVNYAELFVNACYGYGDTDLVFTYWGQSRSPATAPSAGT